MISVILIVDKFGSVVLVIYIDIYIFIINKVKWLKLIGFMYKVYVKLC